MEVHCLLLVGLLFFFGADIAIGRPVDTRRKYGIASGYVEDGVESSNNEVLRGGRGKRYVLSKGKWSQKRLRWRLHNNQLTNNDRFIIRTTLHRAFDVWASVSSLEFVEAEEELSNGTNGQTLPTDIDILFVRGKHGDGLPFDGPEGIVAHAFYPTVGSLHFDADENWTLNRKSGINFYQTAVHEIGHLLGLEHSTDYRAVMFPRNRVFSPEFQLADDDVRGIRRLYPIDSVAQH